MDFSINFVPTLSGFRFSIPLCSSLFSRVSQAKFNFCSFFASLSVLHRWGNGKPNRFSIFCSFLLFLLWTHRKSAATAAAASRLWAFERANKAIVYIRSDSSFTTPLKNDWKLASFLLGSLLTEANVPYCRVGAESSRYPSPSRLIFHLRHFSLGC